MLSTRSLSTIFSAFILLSLAACASPEDAQKPDAPSVQETRDEAQAENQGDAHIEFVRVVFENGTYTFHVTLQHDDTGWEDYADGWDVVLPSGEVVKANANDRFTRLLLHPHDAEPFTRSQSNLRIDANTVTVRGHDLVHGFGGREVIVDLNESQGEKFSVER